MNYINLKELLLSNNIYDEIKQNENQIFDIIPELKNCKGFDQKSKWHIYDVYEHILNVIAGTEENICLRLAALFHDIGKPLTFSIDEKNEGHFYNHWIKSVEIFRKYNNEFNLSSEERLLIFNLIFYHDININKMANQEIDKMLNSIGTENIRLLFCLKRADLLAQSPEYHYLINDINEQEENFIRVKN